MVNKCLNDREKVKLDLKFYASVWPSIRHKTCQSLTFIQIQIENKLKSFSIQSEFKDLNRVLNQYLNLRYYQTLRNILKFKI